MRYRFLMPSALLAMATLALAFGTSRVVAGETSSDELTTLRQAYSALHAADHDYKGHRIRAMAAIRAACKALGANAEGDGKGHEAQGESDAQLKKAQQLLQAIAKTPHAHVAKHVQHALSELSIALSIK